MENLILGGQKSQLPPNKWSQHYIAPPSLASFTSIIPPSPITPIIPDTTPPFAQPPLTYVDPSPPDPPPLFPNLKKLILTMNDEPPPKKPKTKE